jgi:hypothetical protein
VVKYIGRNPAPEQLHHRSLAIGGIDAGTAEFENFPRLGEKRRKIVFVRRIEATKASRCLPSKQPVSSDDEAPATPALVEDQKVIAIIVEAIHVASAAKHF